MRVPSQVLTGYALILERDTREKMWEKLRLRYVNPFFLLETHEKILEKLRLRDVKIFLEKLRLRDDKTFFLERIKIGEGGGPNHISAPVPGFSLNGPACG